MPVATATRTGTQKIFGQYGVGNGTTYDISVAAGTGAMRKYDVVRRPVRGGPSGVVGTGGNGTTVSFTENARFDFELEIWADVTTAGTFTVTITPTGTGDLITMASHTKDAYGSITGLAGNVGRIMPLDSVTGSSCVIFGDSRTAFNNYRFTGNTLTRSNGVVTVSQTSHGLYSNAQIRVRGATDSTFNTSGWVPITYVSANAFSYVDAGPDATTTAGDVMVKDWTSDQGWFSWFNAMAGSPFDVAFNAGISGDTIASMISRVETDVAAYNPAWVFMCAGTNDALTSVPIATIRSGLERLIGATKAACGQLVLVTPFPVRADYPPTDAIRWRLSVIRQYMKDYARANPGVQVWDAYAAVADPSNATRGAAKTNYLFDTVHQSALGAFEIARQGIRDLAAPLATLNNNRPLVAGNGDSDVAMSGATGFSSVGVNLWDNGIWTGTGGTVTGGSGTAAGGIQVVAAGSAATIAAVVTKGNSFAIPSTMLNASPYTFTNGWQTPITVNVAGGTVSDISYSRDGGTTLVTLATATVFTVTVQPGDSLRITYAVAPTVTFIPVGVPNGMGFEQLAWFKAGAASDNCVVRTVTGSQFSAKLTAGGSYYCDLETAFLNVAGSNLRSIELSVSATFDGVTVLLGKSLTSSVTSYPSSDWQGILRTAVFQVPNFTACTNAQWELRMIYSAAGNGMLVKTSQIGVTRVS